MPRRGNGEGSIRQRRADGRWEARYSWAGDGQTYRGSVYGRTRAEVQSKLRLAHVQMEKGARPVPATGAPETVADLMDLWLKYRVGRVNANTMQSQEARVRTQIKPALGHIKLTRLRHTDLERAWDAAFAQGYSAVTVRDAHKLLHQALRWAWRKEWVTEDVGARVDPEVLRHRGRPSRARALTFDELEAVWRVINKASDWALWVTALTTGLRFGELAGLKWSDLDLWHGGVLHVRRTVVRIKGRGLVEQLPKTAGSIRDVLMPAVTRAALAWLDEFGPITEYVFANAHGGPIYQTATNRRWHEIQTLAGIPRDCQVRLHDTRRTLATLEMTAGMGRITQARLGHAAGSMTMHYQDVQTQQPVVDHLNRIFEQIA